MTFAASRTGAQTPVTVTFTNPAGIPIESQPDNDGILVPTSESFAESGMHVEAFWVKNNATVFSQGHFHFHVNNQYETSHGWGTVPGAGSDRMGIWLRREDGGPFDLTSIDYRLKLSLLSTDVLISPTYNPALPALPQFTHFPVVKNAAFQTLNTPGFTNLTQVFILYDLPENGNLYQGELDNFRFSIPAGTCNPNVSPGIAFAHEGLLDPESEGWTQEGAASGVVEGAVANDGGFDAWTVDDNATTTGSSLAFARYPSPDVMCWARTSGWTLRSKLRVVDVPDANDNSVAMSFYDSNTTWELRLGSAANGDPIASITGTSVTLTGLGSGYHTYEMVYDPPTRTVSLRVDGVQKLSNRPGTPTTQVSPPRIAFGSSGDATTGQGNYERVEFELPHKCSNRIDDDGDGLVDYPADPGCSGPNDDTETSACDDGIDNDGDGQTDFPADLGCSSPNDDSERDATLQCDDGLDNDGDLLVDYPADPGCSSPEDPTETTACSDGLDNDGDGLIDFPLDPGCSSSSDDSEQASGLICDDGIDNDGDGLIDYPADPGCLSPADTTETAACSDGIDNDGDGLIDYPADPGCASANDDSEVASALVCDDGIDNDGDGLIDYPADPGCTSPADPTETSACNDGVDNDGDGNTDFPADAGCASPDDDSEKSPTLACDDGIDNDGNGIADYPADPGCTSPNDPTESSACNDGLDNDGDGLVDYPADPGCASASDDSERSPALGCDDGIDNDGDGLVDFPADPKCSSPTDPSEVAACSDGIDNDGDGKIDYPADAGCASATDDSERSASIACDDGIDNDGDGLIDYPADPGCRDAVAGIENPKCQNGIDDDGDGKIDFDGGASAHGGVPIGTADPQCTSPFKNAESDSRCGFGAELALVMPLLAALRRRSRR